MKKDSDVWECKCTSLDFMLQRSGTVTCRKCDAVQSAMSIRFDNPDDQPNKKWSTKIAEWIKTTAGIGYILQFAERVFHGLTPELRGAGGLN